MEPETSSTSTATPGFFTSCQLPMIASATAGSTRPSSALGSWGLIPYSAVKYGPPGKSMAGRKPHSIAFCWFSGLSSQSTNTWAARCWSGVLQGTFCRMAPGLLCQMVPSLG